MKILLATDFSPESRTSLEKVLMSLHQTELMTEILLLNTFIVQETNPELVILTNDRLKLESRSRLEDLKLEAEKMTANPNIKFKTASHLGTFRNVILQLTKKENFNQVTVSHSISLELGGIGSQLREKSCLLMIY